MIKIEFVCEKANLLSSFKDECKNFVINHEKDRDCYVQFFPINLAKDREIAFSFEVIFGNEMSKFYELFKQWCKVKNFTMITDYYYREIKDKKNSNKNL